MTPFFDKILKFTISKKLSVFLIATVLILQDKLDSTQWVQISIMYIGTQGAVDILVQLINSKSSRNDRNPN